MNKISEAVLETLLERITDYECVDLKQQEYEELKEKCDGFEDKESVEQVINVYLLEIGYIYNEKTFKWGKPQKIEKKDIKFICNYKGDAIFKRGNIYFQCGYVNKNFHLFSVDKYDHDKYEPLTEIVSGDLRVEFKKVYDNLKSNEQQAFGLYWSDLTEDAQRRVLNFLGKKGSLNKAPNNFDKIPLAKIIEKGGE